MQKPDLRSIYKGNLEWLVDNTIFLTLHGSHAYGTNTPTSDIDFKGIAIPPSRYFLGLNYHFEQADKGFEGYDGSIYEIRKLFKLAQDCNPNIIEVLFTDPSAWIFCKPAMAEIIENRDIFLSKKGYKTFFGYARSQLKRINTHYRWLKNPPKKMPERSDVGLPERPLIPQNQLEAAIAVIKKRVEDWDVNWDGMEPSDRIELSDGVSRMLAEIHISMDHTMDSETKWIPAAKLLGFDDNFILNVQKEKEFKQLKDDWDSYKTWERERNPQRAALEARFGYDTKHAMHLVRLIRMCREILTSGKVLVKRPDFEYLLAIRNGLLSYEEVVEFADNEERELSLIYNTSTIIPKLPNQEKIDELCERTIRKFLRL